MSSGNLVEMTGELRTTGDWTVSATIVTKGDIDRLTVGHRRKNVGSVDRGESNSTVKTAKISCFPLIKRSLSLKMTTC